MDWSTQRHHRDAWVELTAANRPRLGLISIVLHLSRSLFVTSLAVNTQQRNP